MKYFPLITWLLLALLFFTLVACGKGPIGSPTSNPNIVYTQIWETVAVGQTQTAAAVPPTQAATNTPEATVTPKVTNTPLVSSTPASGDATAVPSSQPTASNTLRPTSQATCDNFQFVSDVTVPDGSEVSAGSTIIKTWQIKNLGPCDWNQDYMLTFGWGGEGTDWKTATPTNFSKIVKPGETLDVSIELQVPSEAGSYGAVFRIRNDDDIYFGPTLTIYIVVK